MSTMMRRSFLARVLLASSLISGPGSAVLAAEGGVSHYLPGLAGDLGFALPPAPGWQVANILWSQSGEIGATVAGGRATADLDLRLTLDIVAASYAFDRTVLGGTYSVGVVVPFGYAELEGELTTSGGARRSFSEDSFGVADMAIIPLQLNWSRGNYHFELSQSIIPPTGTYDEDELVNLGLGYWSFDTIGAFTWLNPNSGTEVSVALGLMHNAENTNTEYHTGNESHLDWAVNQFLTETFAVGLRGYRLNQLKGDSGEGAVLGNLEGFEQGVGAGFVWTPELAHGHLAIAGKYMRDYDVRGGRFDSDYTQLTLGWTF